MRLRPISSPLIVFLAFNLFQWVIWIFSPDEAPGIDNYEAKSYSIPSILSQITFSFVFFTGLYFGSKVKRCNPKSMDPNHLFRLGKITFLISIAASLIKYKTALVNPSVLMAISEVNGINLLYSEFSESFSGVASLQSLSTVSIVIFSLMYFSKAKLRYVGFYLILCIFYSAFVSTINMTRIMLLNSIFVVFFSYALFNAIKIKRLLILLITVPLVFLVGALYRNGLVYADLNNISLIDIEVLEYIANDFFLKYTGGELNNALIMFEYHHDFSNIFYATPLQAFFQTSSPDRYINTINVFGIWYWQFGYMVGLIFTFAVALMFGTNYASTKISSTPFSISMCIYLLNLVAILNMTRSNYIFWPPYILPLLVFLCLPLFSNKRYSAGKVFVHE